MLSEDSWYSGSGTGDVLKQLMKIRIICVANPMEHERVWPLSKYSVPSMEAM
jgi:hypothetical protein